MQIHKLRKQEECGWTIVSKGQSMKFGDETIAEVSICKILWAIEGVCIKF